MSPVMSWLAPVKYTSTQLVYLDELIYLTPASFRVLLLGPVSSLAHRVFTSWEGLILLLAHPLAVFTALTPLPYRVVTSWVRLILFLSQPLAVFTALTPLPHRVFTSWVRVFCSCLDP